MATVLVSALAVAITFLGVCIAWGQWYTARQKLVLDLFEKRYERYQRLRSLLLYFKDQREPNMGDMLRFPTLISEMTQLFGDDVIDGMKKLETAYYAKRRARTDFGSDPTRHSIEEMHAYDADYSQRIAEMHKLVRPYLRMDQKLPRALSEWPRIWWSKLTHRYANRPDGTQ